VLSDGNPRQNVTLAVPRDVLAAAKHLAVDEDTTLSGLFAQLIAAEISRRTQKADALGRIRQRLAHGYALGTSGRSVATREELHER